MGAHTHPAEHTPASVVDLVAEDELALTPDAATVLARIVRARVEGRSESSTISSHTDAAHSVP